ncbi:hypothetical protein POPTR_005G124100v4 [Populus trichocarpa]|uniref:Uncharacterized protein n=1 Tax=Populus trichocarpa TaxID=3694 RepID=A0ACC0SZF4_POPTR|nr:hypothetical protein BDE02_05G106800 [Populus trichocarpa]KAI9394651.1 hypothetical protein POPTR_005G124100v4 [Populus trichocarpa]
MAARDRDLERLIPIQNPDININNIITNGGSNSSSESVSPIISSHHSSSEEAMSKVIRSWASKKFMSGCVILLPMAITFCITWWFISFVDGFFSPIYAHFGVNIFDQSSNAFKEVAIIRHPRHGEYAFGFITSIVILRGSMGAEELCCVYVPTNHLYLGDIFLISSKDILRPNLSVREGIEIVISGGMSIPQILNTMDSHAVHATGLGKFAVPPV